MNQFLFPVIDNSLTGQHLREVCRKKNISASQVHELLCLGSTQTVYDWFKGRTLPSLENMVALSVLLGYTVEDLIILASPGEKKKHPGAPKKERGGI